MSTSSWTDAISVTSVVVVRIRSAAWPAASHSCSVAVSRSWFTSQMATLLPAARKAVAMALPRPPPAPVTNTVWEGMLSWYEGRWGPGL